MALIEIYHVVADYYKVDPDWSADVEEGRLARVVESGDEEYVALATATDVLGVMGDTHSTTTGGTPYADDLVIGAHGSVANPTAKTRSTENRVSDMFNETLASGEMTVYHSGGKFATDQYDTGATNPYTAGAKLYSTAAGLLTSDGAGDVVGKVVKAPKAYPSGVPGADTEDGSLSLGTYLTFVLSL